MNVLLVQPRYPITYWGFQYALPIVRKKVSLPPLGLLTVAGLLPSDWSFRLVDLNARRLARRDLRWADVILTGGMRVQLESMNEVVRLARSSRRPVIVGGPAVSTDRDLFPDADAVFVGEAEGREQELVQTIEALSAKGSRGKADGAARPLLLLPEDAGHPSMERAPIPRFDLLEKNTYISTAVQYSRGCPFNCEFCDVVELFGRHARVKSSERLLAELEALFESGYRGTLFFVDDNFIGNRKAVRRLLPKLARWQRGRGYPFEMYTEASVDLAGDDVLMDEMVAAGFSSVFLGIETPSKAALEQVGKKQNLQLDLSEAVDTITRRGIEVMGGFIVGFDGDREDIFEIQKRFISSLPIPLAMVGVLIALPGTGLHRRLEREGRLREASDGDQFGRPNFEPAMDERELLTGYSALMKALYSPESYYQRCHDFMRRAKPSGAARPVRPGGVGVFARSIWRLGILGRHRREYWRLLKAARARGFMSWAVGKAIQGEHLIRYTHEHVLPRLDVAIRSLEVESSPTSVIG